MTGITTQNPCIRPMDETMRNYRKLVSKWRKGFTIFSCENVNIYVLNLFYDYANHPMCVSGGQTHILLLHTCG